MSLKGKVNGKEEHITILRSKEESTIEKDTRRTGIDVIGNAPWGTHFCQFYQTKQDLIDILVPYFRQGLADNEFCMWITSEPLGVIEAKAALKSVEPGLEDYIRQGQIEILDYTEWYMRTGRFNADDVLQGWIAKLEDCLNRHYDGLRLAGNTLWLDHKDWADFTIYEETVNSIIGNYRMLAICTYSIDKCNAHDIMDVMSNHRFALIKRDGRWHKIESSEHRKTEAALYQSQKDLNRAQEVGQIGSWRLDVNYNVLTWSDENHRIFGVPKGTPMTYETFLEIVHPNDREYVDTQWKAGLAGEPYDIEHRIVVSGQVKWVREKAYLETSDDGVLLGGFGITQDITERKRAEEELRRRSAVLEGISRIFQKALTSDSEEDLAEACLDVALEITQSKFGFIGEIGPDGLLHDMVVSDVGWDLRSMYDKAGHRIPPGGFKVHGLYGKVLADSKGFFTNDPAFHPNSIGTPEGHPPLNAFIGVPLLQDGRMTGIVACGNREGGYVPEDLEALEALAPAIVGVFIRNRAERDLQVLNETLEQQVAERTELAESRARQLQAMAVELVEVEERERRRFADLLHDDLQQILAAARMQLEVICRKLLHEEPALENVGRLLEESIDKSRHLSRELSPAVLHHSGFIPALEWLTKEMSEQFGLHVDIEANEAQQFDNLPLKIFMFRAVQELLFNVVKHAGIKSARVVLSRSETSLLITVSDQGKGFDPDILDHADVTTGFGLLSLRERAHYIGCSLAINSSPGLGSSFTLTVPLNLIKDGERRRRSVDSRRAVKPARSANLSGTGIIRVMFVDDHQVIRQGLMSLVSAQQDITVVGEAANGREAIEQVRQLEPDVVVMDVSMPEMDGIEATRIIKAEQPGVRVIGLSIHDDEQLAQKMRQSGAETLVSKTASSAELLKAIYGPKQ